MSRLAMKKGRRPRLPAAPTAKATAIRAIPGWPLSHCFRFYFRASLFSKTMLDAYGRFRLCRQNEPSAEKRRTTLLLLMIPNQFFQSNAERGSDSFQNVQRGIGVAGFNGAEVPRADKALCGKVVL